MKRRFTDEQMIAILKEGEAGVPVKEICRKHGISDATFSLGGRSLAAWRLKTSGG